MMRHRGVPYGAAKGSRYGERTTHGATMARQSKSILRGALQLAVMSSVLNANPVRDVQPLRSQNRPKGAVALTADQLPDLLTNLAASEFYAQHDLVDPITLLIATGLRRSELLGLRWEDFNQKAGTLTVSGKIIRVPGEGLFRVDDTKSAAGHRTLPLPKFAIEMLERRRQLPYLGEQEVIFLSTAGTLRDPNNFEGMAHGPGGARRCRRDHPQLSEDDRHLHRRRGSYPPGSAPTISATATSA